MKNKILLTLIAVLFLLVGCIQGEMSLSCETINISENGSTYGIRPDEPIVFESTHPLHQERFLKNLSLKRLGFKYDNNGEITRYTEEENTWCKIEFSNGGKTVKFIPTEKNGWDIGYKYSIAFNSPYTVSEDLIYAWRRDVYVSFIPRPEIFYVSQDGTGDPKKAFSWETSTSDLQGLLKFLNDATKDMIWFFSPDRSYASQIWIESGTYEIDLGSVKEFALMGIGIRGNLKKGTNVTGTEYTLICQKDYNYKESDSFGTVLFDNDFLARKDGKKEEVFVEDVIFKGNFKFYEVPVKNTTLITGEGPLGNSSHENMIIWPATDYRYITANDVYVASTVTWDQDKSLLGTGCRILWSANDGDETDKEKYPRFVDPDNNDFRLRSDSCLLKTGKDGKNYGGWQGEGIAVPAP